MGWGCVFSWRPFFYTDVLPSGIRHPEELSLGRKLERSELKKNQGITATRKPRSPHSPNNVHNMSSQSFDGSFTQSPLRTPGTPGTPQVRTTVTANGPGLPGHAATLDALSSASPDLGTESWHALLALGKARNSG